ncbi:selenocysteine-specific translation elongation factor [Piscibacillus salipiscarius]|uniref:selenocysteine-specific translation elongation factor n=1 Tax=Piscibacillus salipiscarius TaxID=299480 RepID=UPI0006CFE919|nr:selenocysteine-specific translation elongation factor [Piscibacillus salipiscarius]
MNKQHYTIGLAGHIDHGKTELVKALTNVDTDRLKEEKERKISIELGYAPLINEDNLNVSIIDVPGHEKFIRQMISGVSSIDLSLLVIAANEGVMPQTLEHMEILNHLGLHDVMIVLTKIDQVDEELLTMVREDLNDTLTGTFLEGQSCFEVDSVSKKGISQLNEAILNKLKSLNSRPTEGHLVLPVDQSFHLHGIGTIIRGTVTQGSLRVGEKIYLLPNGSKAQVKGLHHFNQPVNEVFAGQRAAVALNNVDLADVNRGAVLTNYANTTASSRIDIELNVSFLFNSSIKQRAPIKLHTGTSEIYGKVIFFDRNRLEPDEDVIYAQLVLDQPIYVLKDQRFILRRATPVELIGGGKVIEPFANNIHTTKRLLSC